MPAPLSRWRPRSTSKSSEVHVAVPLHMRETGASGLLGAADPGKGFGAERLSAQHRARRSQYATGAISTPPQSQSVAPRDSDAARLPSHIWNVQRGVLALLTRPLGSFRPLPSAAMKNPRPSEPLRRPPSDAGLASRTAFQAGTRRQESLHGGWHPATSLSWSADRHHEPSQDCRSRLRPAGSPDSSGFLHRAPHSGVDRAR